MLTGQARVISRQDSERGAAEGSKLGTSCSLPPEHEYIGLQETSQWECLIVVDMAGTCSPEAPWPNVTWGSSFLSLGREIPF